MNAAIVFQLPVVWAGFLPLALLISSAAWRQRRRGFSWLRVLALALLRGTTFLALIFLAARPVRVGKQSASAAGRPVMVLVDRSESMSLKEGESSRYQRAVDFLSRRLKPALKSA